MPGQILFTYPLPSDQPLAHAEFGAATLPFDPGSLDGTEAWAAFRADQPPNDASIVWFGGRSYTPGGLYTDAVISKTSENSEAGFLIADADYDDDAHPFVGPWTPSPDSTSLVVSAPGLDAIWGPTSGRAVYVQVGSKCLEDSAIPGVAGSVTPGASVKFDDIPTGDQRITVYANDFLSHPGCSGTLASPPLTATIQTGGFARLYVYSTGPNDVGAVFVPALQ